MSDSTNHRIALAWLGTAIALFLAIVPTWGGPYSPELAVLTATLVVIIWYTYFTFRALSVPLIQREDDRALLKTGLATAVLAEAQWLYGRVRNCIDSGAAYNGRLDHPALTLALNHISAFNGETAQQLLLVQMALATMQEEINQASVRGSNLVVRAWAIMTCRAILRLIDRLEAEGGTRPAVIDEEEIDFSRAQDELPENPFKKAVPLADSTAHESHSPN